MVTPLRFGIVGFGWVARDFMLPALQQQTGVTLAAVCSLPSAELDRLPERVRRYTELEEMLVHEELHAIYIATPNHLHARQTMRCLRAGVPVLCEKPMALRPEEAFSMECVATDTGTPYFTAFDQRYHPAHTRMQALVAAGQLGTITQARIDYACWLPADWCADNWRIDRSKAGGGAIIDLAPHGLDLLEMVLGQPLQDLQLMQQRAVQSYEVDDGGVLMARYGAETLATLHVGYNRPETLPRRQLELIGTQGILRARNTMGQEAGGELELIDAQTGSCRTLDFDKNSSPFTRQLEYFLEALQQEQVVGRHISEDVRHFNLLFAALNPEIIWH